MASRPPHNETDLPADRTIDAGLLVLEMPMTKDGIIAAIQALGSSKECTEIAQAAKARAQAIRTAEYERQIKEYWKRAIFYREGQTLYCNAEGTFLGGPMQRGDKCKVLRIDTERKPMLWVTIKNRSYGFPPSEACRYRLLSTRPAKPINQADRELAKTVAGILDADTTRR